LGNRLGGKTRKKIKRQKGKIRKVDVEKREVKIASPKGRVGRPVNGETNKIKQREGGEGVN